MRRFKVTQSYTVVHPEEINVRSIDLLEDEVQTIADQKPVRKDRPPIGELTFKHFPNPDGHVMYAYFRNKHGKMRKFMKLVESYEVPFA